MSELAAEFPVTYIWRRQYPMFALGLGIRHILPFVEFRKRRYHYFTAHAVSDYPKSLRLHVSNDSFDGRGEFNA